jgi:hypothetical protein
MLMGFGDGEVLIAAAVAVIGYFVFATAMIARYLHNIEKELRKLGEEARKPKSPATRPSVNAP